MALFGWLTGKKKKTSRAKPHPADAMDSVMYEAGVEFGTVPERKPVAPNAQDAVLSAAEQAIEQRRKQRKADRMGRREALFGIVRESMLRAGILSSAYKFKVLSIDQKGRHFLVLLDLSLDLARTEPASRLLEIEKMIVESAQNRVQVTVQAVYWRHYQAAAANPARPAGEGSATVSPLRAAAAARTAAAAAAAPTGESLKAALGSSADSIAAALSAARERMPAAPNTRPSELGGPSTGSMAQATANFAATLPISKAGAAPEVDQSLFASTQIVQRKGDDLSEDEIHAFQQALNAGSNAAPALAASRPAALEANDYQPSIFITGRGQVKPSLHDDDDEDFDGQLSMTQHGELR